MPDAAKTKLTRRVVLTAASAVPLVGLGGLISHLRPDGDAPAALGPIGPFREVFVTPRDDQSTVDVVLCYPYGEAHNPYTEGLAHYLEHLAWQNLQGEDTDGERHSNALTSSHATAYWLSRAPDQLQDTIARLAATAAPLTASEAFALRERDIVEREFDLHRLDDPLDAVWNDSTRSLFGDGPYARSVLGSKDSIGQFSLSSARRLHDQTHQLSVATLILRGPVSPRDVSRAIGAINNWPAPRAALLPEALPLWPQAPLDFAYSHVSGLSRGKVIQEKTFTQPAGFTWAEIYAASGILTAMAHSTKAGGLARPLRYDAFVAASFDLGLSPLGTAGLSSWITAQPDRNVTLSDLDAALTRETMRMLDTPDEAAFEALRDAEATSIAADRDPSETNDSRLFNARFAGEVFVPLSDLHQATASLPYGRFRAFTRHLLSPRSAATRLVTTD
ncbi:insulinase family protein [Donghicola mangrovi]|uniref:Insulinase family protein n=1 Tax=Donghicola mangrovi TaxID=2729614 RepID=A0A850Q8W5_9RHOB|nr:insulinase family protein [Donghicola mangrovi]NVO25586.1 insulinase family protein [Donghicola mangrovi]